MWKVKDRCSHYTVLSLKIDEKWYSVTCIPDSLSIMDCTLNRIHPSCLALSVTGQYTSEPIHDCAQMALVHLCSYDHISIHYMYFFGHMHP